MQYAIRNSLSDTQNLHRKPRKYEKKTVVEPTELTQGKIHFCVLERKLYSILFFLFSQYK